MAARWALVTGLLLLLSLLPSTSSSMMFKLDGNVYPAGRFYVTMYIGEPEKPYFMDIDTGSNLTWLECDAGSGSCETCNKVPHPLYQATPEKCVPCAHPLCKALHQDLNSAQECRNGPRSQCDYEIHYLDGSSSLCLLIFDKFSFTTGNVHPTIAFGYDTQLNLKASLSKSSVEEVHDPALALPLCWKGPRPFKSLDDLKKEFKPQLSLNFGGGVTMKTPP
ncbi:unnamed protein product [Urochloa decumbens]|uniref:Peptidase A1 domain-containing protein n=1 Tax=Urochloa decumbens TaxID=240449 RepID=A0ABC9B6U5_9POAL